MCFEPDSSPPIPVIRGAAVSHEDLVLEARDGNRFAAFAAQPAEPADDDHVEHLAQATQAGVQADVAAADEHLRSKGARTIFTVGFCFGGRNSWLSAAGGHGLAGAIGFYGRPGEDRDGNPGPIQRANELEAPILALQAGADQNISAEDNGAFEQALADAGVEHELITYEGAPHSFFDRKQEEFAEASEDAWRRVLDFIDRRAAES